MCHLDVVSERQHEHKCQHEGQQVDGQEAMWCPLEGGCMVGQKSPGDTVVVVAVVDLSGGAVVHVTAESSAVGQLVPKHVIHLVVLMEDVRVTEHGVGDIVQRNGRHVRHTVQPGEIVGHSPLGPAAQVGLRQIQIKLRVIHHLSTKRQKD
jgi:hypothetical protein